MRKQSQRILIGVLTLGLLLALAVGLSQAQGSDPPEAAVGVKGEVAAAAGVTGWIPVQGRLTDASGNPSHGLFQITFHLYEQRTGGTPLCGSTNPVAVDNGLFRSNIMDCSAAHIDGQQLYLGIQVGDDPEMTPRRGIYPVPYAWSLRPGAIIKDTASGSILGITNHGSGGAVSVSSDAGDAVFASSESGYGVSGTSVVGAGVFGGSLGGPGVVGRSGMGAAISARGTGVITSTAESYVWISGNDVRKYRQSDSTIVNLDSIGGATVIPGAANSPRYAVLPVTVVGPLYGHDVTISALDIYFVTEREFDAITDIRLRRQTGVCDSCYEDILHDATDHTCLAASNEQGCIVHHDLTSNNVLTEDSGILYLLIQLIAETSGSSIRIGGARLTLEHD